MIIRRFQVTDANEISALFREVYAERYVYSDLYVPAMISWRNTQHDWYSAVAVINNKIIGHAALRRENNHATCAELAMIVIHPMAQHRGIAFKLGKYLYDEAHKQQLTTLTIKMVCSHSRSQQLAINLGFHTTALLRDYVSSPFESGHFESVVVGVQALQPRPVPTLGKMNGQPNTLSLLSVPFGNKSPSSIESTRHAFPIEITDVNARINVIIHQATQGIINEISELHHGRLIYLQVPINGGLAKYHPVLYQAGYRDAGLILDNSGEWFWLFQRGFKRQHLQLCCPIAQKLQTDLFLN